jgi:phage terminase large subunit
VNAIAPLSYQPPNYQQIKADRLKRLRRLREHPDHFETLKVYYRDHIPQFISDWGITTDTRNVGHGAPAVLPFILFPKQVEWINWTLQNWRDNAYGLTEKSREVGITWCAVALSCSLCMLYENMEIGFGSNKLENVDSPGQPGSILEKVRIYMEYMPPEFSGNWSRDRNGIKGRITFPATKSLIIGQGGDDIGRGDRKAIYFVDEAAHLEHPFLNDAALAATTNCRQDMSSVNGMDNSFARRRWSGLHRVFTYSYRDDPRKDDAWAVAKQIELHDPVVWEQEYGLNYAASREGIVFLQVWAQACIDSHIKLGIDPTGVKSGALDIADEGRDVNAFAARHGMLVTDCLSWSGKDRNVGDTANRAYDECDRLGLAAFVYDADGGYGSGVKSECVRIDERRVKQFMRRVRVSAFRGSGAVYDPEKLVPGTDVKAKDRFQNAKAQGYWWLAELGRNTYEAVNGRPYDPEMLISFSSTMKQLNKFMIEISQPRWKHSSTGKLMVDKTPDGEHSPNLADAVMMLMAPKRLPIKIDPRILDYEAA